jgi:hypothetical protein
VSLARQPFPGGLVRPRRPLPARTREHHDDPVTLAPQVPAVLSADRRRASAAGAIARVREGEKPGYVPDKYPTAPGSPAETR